MKINCKLFGFPEIFVDNTKILFPYSKIYALIYYVLVEKSVSRSELSELLWPDEGDVIGKKNLRNAIYHAKKILHPDFILTPNNSILQLNEKLDIYVDVEKFEENPGERLDLYEGEFLKGFFVKNAGEFDNWINNKRLDLQEKYYLALYEKLKSNISMGIYKNVELAAQRLISMDNYDEKTYRLLMEYYFKTDRISKVIEVYRELSDLLHRELKIEPEDETKNIYFTSIEKLNPIEEGREEHLFYFGREKEISTIHNVIRDYKNGSSSNSVFIDGEVGVGKSALINIVFQDFKKDYKIVSVRCFQIEYSNVLKSIEFLIKKLGNQVKLRESKEKLEIIFNKIKEIQRLHRFEEKDTNLNEELEDLLIDTLEDIGNSEKMIIHFEDIHWMDKMSLFLLVKMALNLDNILFFFSGRGKGNLDIDDLISTLSYYDRVKTIELFRFSEGESYKFLQRALPDLKDRAIFNDIYRESEGLPAFLLEYAKLIKSNKTIDKMTVEMENTIKSRFSYLDKEHREMLEVLSLFTNGFPEDIVHLIFQKEEYMVLELLDKLLRRGILEEFYKKGNLYFKFSHNKVREYLYSLNSKPKRKYLHKEIGNIIESMSIEKFDELDFYKALVYHFREAGEDIKKLKYNLKILNHYLNFSHELFPVLAMSRDDFNGKVYLPRSEVRKMFKDLEYDLKEVRFSEDINTISLLELEFYYLRGRYYIRDGHYDKGLEDIIFVIRRSIDLKERDFELSGYKQMIFYNIQKNNAQEMLEYVNKALELAVDCNYLLEIGMLLRLKGLYYLMVGNYEESESFLRESINGFYITKSVATSYSVNIAAAHNYLGELKLAQKRYDEAIEEFEEAVNLTKERRAYTSLSIFYINIGKAYFAKGDFKNARRYFKLALAINENFELLWKTPVLDAYMALSEVIKGNYEEARMCLEVAIKYSDKMEDPRDLGTVNFVLYLISNGKNLDINKHFGGIINEDGEVYRKRALENLDKYRDIFEIEVCNNENSILFEI